MSRSQVDTILERVDLLARRFEDLDRVWFYARITQKLRERCREQVPGPDRLDSWKQLLEDASKDTEEQMVKSGCADTEPRSH